ncbi:type I polyketide synthase [Winogradskya consettensis]|uniref:Polyketide synthase n=2 Tax=Winogradskya consettensis TaxID=113560 RepID=A0A919T2I7_9ACTN|nr:polyketide synthase [Actinoplanes consettensis]
MNLTDYWSPDPAAPDRFYARNAAVLEGWEFDRVSYRVAGSTYRSTDLTHWLALDVAAAALADAGFPMAAGLPHERTAVVVGNSLTGEFSRANQIRLRWPYVRRTVAAALAGQGWEQERLAAFLDGLETDYKRPFPAIDEDTLAGSLSNTIAGRICNYFDLKGGGYTVDGACSSSLLSITTACRALDDKDVDVVVAGGVDLSIDPLEIIGFAKTGALASGEMKVYDRGSTGFWPGEGCGMVVLMREAEARAAGHRIYATIAGWGISSDGKGGITRPEVSGYQLALRRAYERAGFPIGTVALFEGHGTGTKVGDQTELTALSEARRAQDRAAAPAVISSVKSMIGHTKAAAGVAGFIKAVMAVHREVLPPALGCPDPHELFGREDPALRVLRRAENWPQEQPVRAGITAMGFGGINTHVVVENSRPLRAAALDARTESLSASIQDSEMLAFAGTTWTELRNSVADIAQVVGRVSYAQMADLAAMLRERLRDQPCRAAAVVVSPEDAERQLNRILAAVDDGRTQAVTGDDRIFLGHVSGPARVGFLFPGQGSGTGTSGGALGRRFPSVRRVYGRAGLPTGGDMVATEVAQPRIAAGSVAGLHALAIIGLSATLAVGHSLGELAALRWAGVMDDDTLLRVATLRGDAMSRMSESGTMAGLVAGPDAVATLVADLPVVISGYNGPAQTVVSGTAEAVDEVCRRAGDAGIRATPLAVSHAFHSPLVAPAAEAFAASLDGVHLGSIARRIISTVTGESANGSTDVVTLLRRQITDPVMFNQAVVLAAQEVDLFVEVGPGRVLSRLAAGATAVPAVALDTDDETLVSLLKVCCAAYVLGAAGVPAALFDDRLVRPLRLDGPLAVLTSPCESAPMVDVPGGTGNGARPEPAADAIPGDTVAPAGITVVEEQTEQTVDLLRRLAAERAELPVDMVHEDSMLLDELHLSSITVGTVVNELVSRFGIPASRSPLNFATASIRELADTIDDLRAGVDSGAVEVADSVAGAAGWARAWSVDRDPTPLPASGGTGADGTWSLHARDGDAFARALRDALQQAGVGSGVLVCLPPSCTETDLELALDGAHEVIKDRVADRFVLVDAGRGAAGLAKTLRLEKPSVRVTIVHTPPENAASLRRVVDEVRATTDFSEAMYDDDGVRTVPVLRVMPVVPQVSQQPLDETDVLLVTGGGKGITAECALAIAVDTGVRLAIVGRSDPRADAELAENLERMAQMGVKVDYARADVTDPDEIGRAVRDLTTALGTVTAVLHGAGSNDPAALPNVDMAAVRRACAPKVQGLSAVLAAVDPQRIRLLVTLGSIIGRTGLRGEAHYAVANDWMAELTREYGQRNPHCRSICLEWSVWSGVGMGERLSVIENLTREGITPITPDQGVEVLRRLLADPQSPPVVVISGRTSGIDTIRYDTPELPLLRFVQRPLVHYAGVELITEVDLSAGTDLYLADHRLDDSLLFPAVFGMEAMAQVGSAALGAGYAPMVERAEFLRPIVVPVDGTTRIRIAAVVTGPGTVEVVIRSAETAFGADHFQALLRFGDHPVPQGPPVQAPAGTPVVDLHPATDLYSDVLFQGGRFQRLRRYHRATAREVDAVVQASPVTWFAGYLPGRLLLGDPGVRDALMHGNQVCVPHATLLPSRIERIFPAGEALSGDGEFRYSAVERLHDGDTYVYDIALRDAAGEVVERWEGLTLRAVRKGDGAGPWAPALLGTFLERSLDEMAGTGTAVALEPDGGRDPEPGGDLVAARRARSAVAVSRVTGEPTVLRHRPDGRPEVDGDRHVSLSHGAGMTLCTIAPGLTACDMETVEARPLSEWQGLIGRHAELLPLLGGDADPRVAATRVWVALECLQKAGRTVAAPLTVRTGERAGWLVFASGILRIFTFATAVKGCAGPVVIGILTEGRRAE